MKRGGQVTIFIIVGIVLVVGLALLFLFKKDIVPEIGGGTKEINPSFFMKSCMYDKIQDTVDIMINQGGLLEYPIKQKFRFSGDIEYSNISLLCYTSAYGIPCINQNPNYFTKMKNQLKNEIATDMKNCFDEYIDNLEKEYEVESNYNDFEIKFRDNMIVFNIDAKITTTKSGETKTKEDFYINYNTRFYSLTRLAHEIIVDESVVCNFNIPLYLLKNPQYNIRRVSANNAVKIYLLQHEETSEKLKFGVRGCSYP